MDDTATLLEFEQRKQLKARYCRFAPGVKLQAYGHDHETYEKTGGTWRFTTSTLTRVPEDLMTPLGTLQLTDRVKRLIPGARP